VAAGPLPALSNYAAQGVFLSLYLALFNLLPIPPLDGSKLLLATPSIFMIRVYQELTRFGFVLLIVAMSATDLGRWLSRFSWEGTLLILRVFG